MAGAVGNQEIARRYALALFDLAKEQGGLDATSADMLALNDMIGESADLVRLMSDTTLKRNDQARAIQALAVAAKFAPLTKNFVGTLAQKRRLALLPEIISAVQKLIAAHKGEVTAEVVAAQALEQSHIESIAAALKKALGLNVKMIVSQDASLMGGLVIKVGSQLIDSSVKTKLERLTRALKTQTSSSDNTKMREVA